VNRSSEIQKSQIIHLIEIIVWFSIVIRLNAILKISKFRDWKKKLHLVIFSENSLILLNLSRFLQRYINSSNLLCNQLSNILKLSKFLNRICFLLFLFMNKQNFIFALYPSFEWSISSLLANNSRRNSK
jgi:hypothetical protein